MQKAIYLNSPMTPLPKYLRLVLDFLLGCTFVATRASNLFQPSIKTAKKHFGQAQPAIKHMTSAVIIS